MFYYHDGTELDISNRKTAEKSPTTAKLKNTVINNPWVKKKSRQGNQKIF